MDLCLRNRLPLELVEIIMRMAHRMRFERTLHAIAHNLVWIRCPDGEYSFLIHTTPNYYHPLIQWVNGLPVRT
jgi:hypothetical protein